MANTINDRMDALLWVLVSTYAQMNNLLDEIEKELAEEDELDEDPFDIFYQ